MFVDGVKHILSLGLAHVTASYHGAGKLVAEGKFEPFVIGLRFLGQRSNLLGA